MGMVVKQPSQYWYAWKLEQMMMPMLYCKLFTLEENLLITIKFMNKNCGDLWPSMSMCDLCKAHQVQQH